MKKLYLHIGLSKTGSSALQSWLSLNTAELAKQGFYYADLAPSAKDGKITAGNGVALFNACKEEKFSEVKRLIKKVYFNANDKAIISSETLQNISPKSIAKIKEICDSNEIVIKVVSYVRSAYEMFYSNYLQGIKRHGFSYKFGDKGGFSYSNQVNFLNNYLKIFDSSLVVKNYDIEKVDIFSSFSDIIGFDTRNTVIQNKTVNRSLTYNEAEVLRVVNSLHEGDFSAEISDFLIAQLPDKKTSVYYRDDLLRKVEKNCINDVAWINKQFFDVKEYLLPYHKDKISNEVNAEADNEHDAYQIVVDWCLSDKKKNKEEEYVDFIRKLAVKLEKSDLDLAYKLMNKALKLRPNGLFIKNRISIYKRRMNSL